VAPQAKPVGPTTSRNHPIATIFSERFAEIAAEFVRNNVDIIITGGGAVVAATFATVRHRTIRSKGCLSNKTARAMVFKLVEAAQKSWRRLRGYNQLPKVVQGVKFADGIEVVRSQAQAAA
jgi:hypothetical protein